MARRTIFLLRLVIGGSVLAIIIARVRFSELAIPSGPGLVATMLACFTLTLVAQALAALRWRLILGPGAPPWRYLWRLYLVGAFFSLFLPTSVGGDAVRAAAATRTLGSPGTALASVVVDRSMGILALVGYFVLGLVVAPGVFRDAEGSLHWTVSKTMVIGFAAAPVVAAMVGAVLLRRSPTASRLYRDALKVTTGLARRPGDLLGVAGLAALVQGTYILVWGLLAAALRLGLDWSILVATVPLVSLAAMLPLTVSGMGLREGAWIVVLASYHIPSSKIVAFSLLFFSCVICVGLVGGLVFITRGTGMPDIAIAEAIPLEGQLK